MTDLDDRTLGAGPVVGVFFVVTFFATVFGATYVGWLGSQLSWWHTSKELDDPGLFLALCVLTTLIGAAGAAITVRDTGQRLGRRRTDLAARGLLGGTLPALALVLVGDVILHL